MAENLPESYEEDVKQQRNFHEMPARHNEVLRALQPGGHRTDGIGPDYGAATRSLRWDSECLSMAGAALPVASGASTLVGLPGSSCVIAWRVAR
jgi:hypothetical protein